MAHNVPNKLQADPSYLFPVHCTLTAHLSPVQKKTFLGGAAGRGKSKLQHPSLICSKTHLIKWLVRTDNHLGFIGSDPDKLWRLWHTGVIHGTVRRKRGITVFALTSGKPRLRGDGQDSKSLTQQNHAVSEMTERNPGCEIIIYSSQAVFLVLPFKITSIKKFTNLHQYHACLAWVRLQFLPSMPTPTLLQKLAILVQFPW